MDMGSTSATALQFHEDVDDVGEYGVRVGLVVRPPSSLLKDLKVTVHHKSLVFPSHETEKKSFFLSNIDQFLNFDVHTVHFFAAHRDFSSDLVAEKLKQSLANILVPYDFLAGRLKSNPNSGTGGGRLEIECNAAGAGFVVASSEYALHEIGDLVYPNSAFAQLICISMDVDHPRHENDASIEHPASAAHRDHPLCILQVTTFKCGGFAMGISTNHVTFDGLSFRLFLDNLAAVAGDKPLAIIPYKDRKILAAGSPPRVAFPHPELQELKMCSQVGQDDDHLSATVFEATEEELDFKIFRLSSVDLIKLKEKAKPTGSNSTSSTEGGPKTISSSRGVTSFNVVTALIWRCKALSACDHQCGDDDGMDRESRILYAVDIRPRLTPPLPTSYTGNAVLTAYAAARCRELEQGPFSRTVEMVNEGAARMTDEYARSVIDWGELHKGFPHGDVLVSSWWKLGFAEVEYPWGKPRYSCPVVYHRKDIILLFPDEQVLLGDHNDAAGCGGTNGGVNILVALPHKEMQKFLALFLKFLLAD
ncbi:hypothetical protein ABKV19_022513 [Rosa sericea]